MAAPPGIFLSPQKVLHQVETDAHTEGPFYRHRTGRLYAVGLREDRDLWKQAGFQLMGSVALLRRMFEVAQHQGVRDKSLVWYLLSDVEQETQRIFEA